MGIYTRLHERYDLFTGNDRLIADYFIKNSETACLMSADALGRATGTSASAVIRFMKRLDYNSLNEVRAELSKGRPDAEAVEYDPIVRREDSLQDITAKLTSLIGNTAQSLSELVNYPALKTALEKLDAAKTIYLFGIGASGIVAEDLYRRFVRIGRSAFYHYDSHIQIATSVNITPDDAVVAFSFSGASAEIVRAAKQARENGAYIVAVTKAVSGPLAEFADYTLPLPNTEGDIRIAAIASRYAELLASDIIFMSIAQHSPEKTTPLILKSYKLLHPNK